jgi:hypothetical protein
MSFEDTEFYKQFGDAEWKVTDLNGKIHKSKKWLLKYEDVIYKEVTPYVKPKAKSKDTLSYVRPKSKTVLTTKFKAT